MALSEELEGHKEKVKVLFATSYETASYVDVAAVRETLKSATGALLSELQNEWTEAVERVKTEGVTLTDAVDRLKKLATLVDKELLTPLKTEVRSHRLRAPRVTRPCLSRKAGSWREMPDEAAAGARCVTKRPSFAARLIVLPLPSDRIPN